MNEVDWVSTGLEIAGYVLAFIGGNAYLAKKLPPALFKRLPIIIKMINMFGQNSGHAQNATPSQLEEQRVNTAWANAKRPGRKGR